MRRAWIALFPLFIALLACAVLAAERQANPYLAGAALRVERLREKAAIDLREIDAAIGENERVVRKSGDILRLARQKGNRAAEQAASEALQKAEDAKKRNLAARQAIEARLKRTEEAYDAAVRQGKEFTGGLLIDRTGHVDALRDGSPVENGQLRQGDRIHTGPDGRAELGLLRGTLIVGSDTAVRLGEGSVELERGKIHLAVEKAAEMLERVEDKLKAYGRDIETIAGIRGEDLVHLEKLLKYELEKMIYRVRTPTAVCGVRGTEFTVEAREEGRVIEITVIEGEVEGFSGNGSVTVGGGSGVTVRQGVTGTPTPLSRVQRWWEF